MPISESDFRAMQERCDRGMKKPQPHQAPQMVSKENPPGREVGKGGTQDQIEEWLMTQSHRAWWDRKRTDKATTSRKGVPDFVGVISGISFGVEVKRPGEKATIDQLGELAWLRKAGAKTAIVFSKDEAVEFFNNITNEHTTTIEGPGVATPAETPDPNLVPPEADAQAATAAVDRLCAGDRPENLHHQLDRPLRPANGPADDDGAADTGSRKDTQ